MSVLKKLASLLFEETDAEVLAEDELEEIEVKEKPRKNAGSAAVKEEVKRTPTQTYFHPEETNSKESKDEKKFVAINLDDAPKEKETVVAAQEPLRVRKPTKREEKKEYEFSPVISPIFGSKEEAKSMKKKSVAAVGKKKKNPLGTIISPYYGVGELEEFEAKAQEKIEEKEKMKNEELLEQDITKYDLEEEINSVSLEDMLEKNEEGAADDLMQISLFGDSTPIRDAQTVKDNE